MKHFFREVLEGLSREPVQAEQPLAAFNYMINAKESMAYLFSYAYQQEEKAVQINNTLLNAWKTARVLLAKAFYMGKCSSRDASEAEEIFQEILKQEEAFYVSMKASFSQTF